jgi:hypothetical protein
MSNSNSPGPTKDPQNDNAVGPETPIPGARKRYIGEGKYEIPTYRPAPKATPTPLPPGYKR